MTEVNTEQKPNKTAHLRTVITLENAPEKDSSGGLVIEYMSRATNQMVTVRMDIVSGRQVYPLPEHIDRDSVQRVYVDR